MWKPDGRQVQVEREQDGEAAGDRKAWRTEESENPETDDGDHHLHSERPG